MLVLSRRRGEFIVLPELDINIVVVEIRGDKVRLGINAPQEYQVHRSEVWETIKKLRNSNQKPPDAGKDTTR